MVGGTEHGRTEAIPDNGEVPDKRGHHKVFLGMAAGAGKTYRMLQEAQAEAAAGRDVVIGYLEPHGRVDTSAQAEGLEVVPHRQVVYRDTTMEEMDLPAILGRAPEICLIDELAHTNAPGVEHGKRYEDVDDVLAAGIDVFSTVNVQHLESLNNRVAELTGVWVRETFPDSVLASADEVVLVDLTPEALIARLQAGKVYPPERVPAALNNFFKVESLAALREVALRQVAEEVGTKRIVREEPLGTREDRLASAASEAVAERLLALVTADRRSQRLVRRAARSANRLGGELDILYVAASPPSEEQEEQLRALRKLGSLLGANVLVEHGDDIVEVAARVARERGTTYVLMGEPASRGLLRRFAEPLPQKLMHRLPGVDIRIIADRSKRQEAEDR
jgi:two-component system, OmpR family, sensor histidine kinase KdpD